MPCEYKGHSITWVFLKHPSKNQTIRLMEIESVSDAERIAGNADVLGTVELEIVRLEGAFTQLESLKTERDRLTAAVRTLTEEETRTLHGRWQ
jgi:hypothetical protein